MTTAIPDYTDEVEKPEGGELAQLAILAQRQEDAERAVAEAEAVLRSRQAALLDISEKQIPELMEKLGLQEFKTADRLKVAVKKTLRVSVPEQSKSEAHAWLEQNGNGSLIKRAFHVLFGREEEEFARRFMADLKRRKRQLNVTETKKVEPATLNKALRELLEKGVAVPLELFGAYWQKQAKIERLDG